MANIGIICEYNPFHNGHLYHINKIKEMFKDSTLILVMSGNFTQRGIPSILNKKEKTLIAKQYGIDLIVELPFIYATESADIFANAAITILNQLKVDYIVFGSESNDIENLINIANIQLNDKGFDKKVKNYLSEGINYPTAISKALKDKVNIVNTPNDLLAISYIKSIIKNNYTIEPISIQRTNDFHSKELENNIVSATAIREALYNNKDISNYVPKEVSKLLKNKSNIDYFNYLKYKIISEGTNIKKYLTVDEGIENRILKVIDSCNTLEELIKKVKTKRYTYNKLSRMFIHILCSLTKEEVIKNKDIKYIRLLGFNDKGRKYLNKIKKDINIPLITTPKYYNELLAIENRIDKIYDLITVQCQIVLVKPKTNDKWIV